MTANITIKSKKIPVWAVVAGAALLLVLVILAFVGLSGGKEESDTKVADDGKTTTQVISTEKRELEIVDSGYTIYHDNEYFNYGVVIRNPNETYAVDFPTITITAYDNSGDVITTSDQVISKINPGETRAFGNLGGLLNGVKPEKITFEIDVADRDYTQSQSSFYSRDIVITNQKIVQDSYGRIKVTGQVENKSENDFDIALTVIFKKNGKIIAGETTYVDNLNAGKKKPFEFSSLSFDIDSDEFDIYVQEW